MSSEVGEFPENTSELLVYQTEDGQTRVQVVLQDETVWMTQNELGRLLQVSKQNISLHIRNIFEEGELERSSTVKEYLTVRTEGSRDVRRKLNLYNLDVIISVGYRVRSHRGTQFRIWATQRLREYLIKGFALDDERLKRGPAYEDYFDELLERVRDIRTSEARFYQKVCDIFTTSIDYSKSTDVARQFFSTVQNKFHWAIHGHTAAELIINRADANKPNMGLTTWQGSKVRKNDVTIAKNYLTLDELQHLNLLVDQYLSFAESQAKRRIPMYMKDWMEKLHGFLKLNDRPVLEDFGSVSATNAQNYANSEYKRYTQHRQQLETGIVDNGFDAAIKRLVSSKKESRSE